MERPDLAERVHGYFFIAGRLLRDFFGDRLESGRFIGFLVIDQLDVLDNRLGRDLSWQAGRRRRSAPASRGGRTSASHGTARVGRRDGCRRFVKDFIPVDHAPAPAAAVVASNRAARVATRRARAIHAGARNQIVNHAEGTHDNPSNTPEQTIPIRAARIATGIAARVATIVAVTTPDGMASVATVARLRGGERCDRQTEAGRDCKHFQIHDKFLPSMAPRDG